MDNDPELKVWTSDWQAGAEGESSATAISVYAHGRNRFMWTWVLSELAVGAIALPLLLYAGWVASDVVQRWAMWLLALVTLAATCVGWWNWRGALLASARTTADYVMASTERLRRMRQAWRIGWIILAAEVAIFSVWTWNRLYGEAAPVAWSAELFAWSWLTAMSLSAVGFLLWMDRWIKRDAEKFASLKRELEESDIPVTSPERRPPTSGSGLAPGLRARLRSRNRAFRH